LSTGGINTVYRLSFLLVRQTLQWILLNTASSSLQMPDATNTEWTPAVLFLWLPYVPLFSSLLLTGTCIPSKGYSFLRTISNQPRLNMESKKTVKFNNIIPCSENHPQHQRIRCFMQVTQRERWWQKYSSITRMLFTPSSLQKNVKSR
jgi:hypothetical protein